MNYSEINSLSVLIIHHDDILVTKINDTVTLPTRQHINQIIPQLSIIANDDYEFVASVKNAEDIGAIQQNIPTAEFTSIRSVMQLLSPDFIHRIIYYKSLLHYYEQKFCGYCANTLSQQKQNKFLYCNQCKREIYPHIAPSIIVRITKGEQILLARNINFAPGVWALIAGYVEIGESLEQAVKREVREEVGIAITNIRYFGSEPWPFPGITLMAAFTAEYASGELDLQEDEIVEAGFFIKDNLPGLPSSKVSIAYRMIMDFCQN